MHQSSSTYRPSTTNATLSAAVLRFAFSGKEKDLETGLSYFGARYYDADLTTGWLSVDPMADKYPSMSPYNYCAGNPVKLVDPDGLDVWTVDEKGSVSRAGGEGGADLQTVTYSNGTKLKYQGKYYQNIFKTLSIKDKNGLSFYKGTEESGSAISRMFLDMADNTSSEWKVNKTKDNMFTLSTLHKKDLSPSLSDLGISLVNAFSEIHSHPSAGNDYDKEIASMGIIPQKGFYGGDYGIRNKMPKNYHMFVYMKNSHKVYQLRQKLYPAAIGDKNKNPILFTKDNMILSLLKGN
ncbi:MAG: hypothetical protein MJZ51_03410 [Bacteroidales bacterium]|nr:hypothetical protein [Bacteroidales bacterium]